MASGRGRVTLLLGHILFYAYMNHLAVFIVVRPSKNRERVSLFAAYIMTMKRKYWYSLRNPLRTRLKVGNWSAMATTMFKGVCFSSNAVCREVIEHHFILDLRALNNSCQRHYGYLRTVLPRMTQKWLWRQTILLQYQAFTPAPKRNLYRTLNWENTFFLSTYEIESHIWPLKTKSEHQTAARWNSDSVLA